VTRADTVPAHPLRGTLLVLVSAACFGTTLILTQRGLDGGATLPALLAYRYALGSVMLAIVAGGVAPVIGVGERKWRLLLIGGGSQALLATLTVLSLRFIPAASVAFLFYTYPTWVALLAIVRRTERVEARKVLALVLSLAGIVTIIGNPLATQLDPRGIGLALAAAIVYALMIPWLGRIQEGLKPAPAVTWITLGAAACFAVGAVATQSVVFPPTPSLLLWATALAVFPTTIAFITFLAGLAALGPVKTSIVSTVEPFWTAVLAGLVLGQPVGPRTWIGGAMIAAAMVVLQRTTADAN